MSIFISQPPGDMPTRKSVFDTVLLGCIPVFFNPLTAIHMYPWHWNISLWQAASVQFYGVPGLLLNGGNSSTFNVVDTLIDLFHNNRSLIEKKQSVISDKGALQQYSFVNSTPKTGHSY